LLEWPTADNSASLFLYIETEEAFPFIYSCAKFSNRAMVRHKKNLLITGGLRVLSKNFNKPGAKSGAFYPIQASRQGDAQGG